MAQSGSLPLHKRFNEVEMKRDIKNRYMNTSAALPRQLKYLKESVEFASVVKKLRKNGWKDWHILLAIFNIVINFKNPDLKNGWYPKTVEEKKKIVGFKEDENYQPYSNSEFTEEKLQQYFHFALTAVCKTMGFAFRRRDIKINKIEIFLRNRMLFFELDVEHEDFFPLAKEKNRQT